jgi:hypothetical protein
MGEIVKLWDPNEWEEYIKSLLRLYYGPGQFVEVPAKHGGDFGIEGFGRNDGCAYQCYAAELPLSTEQLYTKQRNKVTIDLGKFASNKSELVKLFGTTKISRWILAAPLFESAKLVQHLAKKTKEIRAKNLPYVAADFEVCIETDDMFAVERHKLMNLGLSKLDIPVKNPQDNELTTWQGNNPKLIETLDEKLMVLLGKEHDPKDLAYLRNDIVRKYLQGQNLLQDLHDHYPDFYEIARRRKDGREASLATTMLLSSAPPNVLFNQVLEQFIAELNGSMPSLDKRSSEVIGWEAVADWLVKCPLRFRGTNICLIRTSS